ncbi:cellulose synthase/poly-beta-1,6-N-acetylglucosamine synthase-like glycosyltransferase [Virgibacillus halotolerans]|uniref:hypothetical protein n=1 Tax=Virgibacillus halotolerans TaxID=1071053 RepID=UPI001960B0F8|nr:hypothetical protein [Virgibacillus halotolerans]MBM7601583.1 cellulose synthase/poly-beta-1,6-N-acetylglucosamine synthase-like glycosyltransferase [Virgibacillus halotolerans]
MNQSAEFVFLQPIFIAFIIILLTLLLIIVFQKTQIANLFTLFSIGLISSIISAIMLYMSGYIVDEYGLGGDTASFFMFLAIVGLSIVNFFVFLIKDGYWKPDKIANNK